MYKSRGEVQEAWSQPDCMTIWKTFLPEVTSESEMQWLG